MPYELVILELSHVLGVTEIYRRQTVYCLNKMAGGYLLHCSKDCQGMSRVFDPHIIHIL
jgi:hypothetical protein